MFDQMTPAVRGLIFANLAMFVLSALMPGLQSLLAVYYFNSPNFRPWQILTHQFMHGGLMHLAFNMYMLYMVGSMVERVLGIRRFLQLYFLSGIGAYLFHTLVSFGYVHLIQNELAPTGFNLYSLQSALPDVQTMMRGLSAAQQGSMQELLAVYYTPMVGASGAIFGVLLAFAYLFPDARMMLLFPPIPLSAKWLVGLYLVLEIYLGWSSKGQSNVAHFAHVGGALTAWLVLRSWYSGRIRR